jgi:hypothetical protein
MSNSWCSKRQPIISLSITEVDYWVATMAAQESTLSVDEWYAPTSRLCNNVVLW